MALPHSTLLCACTPFCYVIIFCTCLCYVVWNSDLHTWARIAIPAQALLTSTFAHPIADEAIDWMWTLEVQQGTSDKRVNTIKLIWTMYAVVQLFVFVCFLVVYPATMWYNLSLFGVLIVLYYLVYRRNTHEYVISGLFQDDKMSIIFMYSMIYVYKNWDHFHQHTLINIMFLGYNIVFVSTTGTLDKYRFTHLAFVFMYGGVVLFNRGNFIIINHLDDPHYVIACSMPVFEICDQLVKKT